jgi:hypothetical protein
MKLSGYQTYCQYLAVKNHFTKASYDYFKYNGKVHVTKESFLARRDRFQFEKLGRSCDDLTSHLVANFLKDKAWVGELLDDAAFDATKEYVKINQSMSYVFRNDLNTIGDIKHALSFGGHQYPNIIPMVMSGSITPQTFVILDKFVGFTSKFDAKLPDDFVWSKLGFKLKRFVPFIWGQVDQKKFANILKDHVAEAI